MRRTQWRGVALWFWAARVSVAGLCAGVRSWQQWSLLAGALRRPCVPYPPHGGWWRVRPVANGCRLAVRLCWAVSALGDSTASLVVW